MGRLDARAKDSHPTGDVLLSYIPLLIFPPSFNVVEAFLIIDSVRVQLL